MRPKLTPEELTRLRRLMGFGSRRMLAEVLNISTRTLESWEQGIRSIPGWLRVALWGVGITSRFGEGYGTGRTYPVTELPSILGVTEDTISEAVSRGTLPVRSKRGVLEVDYDALLNFYIFILQNDNGRIHMAIDRLTLITEPGMVGFFQWSDVTYDILISLGCSVRGIIGPYPPDQAKSVKDDIISHLKRGILLLRRVAPEVLLGSSIEVQEHIIEEATKRLALLQARQMLVVFSEEGEAEVEQERVVQSILPKIDVETALRTLQDRFRSRRDELFKLLDAFAHPAPGSMAHFTDLSALRDVSKILHYNILRTMGNAKPTQISLESLRRIEDLASQRLSGRLAEHLWNFLEDRKS